MRAAQRMVRGLRARFLALGLIAGLTVLAAAAPSAMADSGTLSLLAGNGIYGSPTAPGPATSSAFQDAEGVAVDHVGNVYFADSDDHEVFKVTPAGQLSVVAGNGTSGTATAGPATSSELHFPNGVALDASGDLYIADTSNRQIYKVTPAGTLSIIAGNGTSGAPTPGPATSSPLGGPADVKVDASGNVYIADFNGNRVEKVTPGGTLSVVAGTGVAGAPVSGTAATTSPLHGPAAVAIDSAGNLYIADQYNSVVEKVTPAGTLSIFAGNGTQGPSTAGAATSSELDYPDGLAVDSSGDVYITDNSSAQVVKVDPSGQLSIIAGNGVNGASTYGGPATSSPLGYPFGIAITPAGGLVMGDDGNDVVDLIGALITAPTATIDPVITGTAAVGQTLSSDTGTWLDYPTSYAYQWEDCDSSGANCTPISGAVASTYTIEASDDGHTVRVIVTATNGIGSTSAVSAPSLMVPAASVPTTTPIPTTTATPTPSPAPTTSGDGVGISSKAMSTGVSVSGNGDLQLPLVCPQTVSGCDADGTLALTLPGAQAHAVSAQDATPATAQSTVIARFAGIKIEAGHSRLVAVRLSPAAIRSLQDRGVRRVRVTLTIHNHLTGGPAVTTVQQLSLDISALLASCPAASGSLTASHIGTLTLLLTHSQAHRLGRARKAGRGFERYCQTHGATRVAYPLATLARHVPAAERRLIAGRVIVALTANQHYTIRGVRSRMSVHDAAARLSLGRGFVIGTNTWYVIHSHGATWILKAQRGVIREIGITLPSLTHTRAQQSYLLRHL